ncbi:MAG: M42 family metallopeptidase [Fimbriimonas sp.]
MNIELLKELTEARGIPGQEDLIRAIVRRELSPLTEIKVDKMGNLICHKPGKGPKVMIAAHMDEIGFIVKFIDKNGFLRIQPLGGFDPQQLCSQRVIVNGKSGPLQGLLMMSAKPIHMRENDGKAPKIDTFFIDLGLSEEEVRANVRLGDMVTMDRTFVQTGNLLSCKCMDDRVGVFVMIEAIKALGDHEADIYAVATVQEEIGLRGAAASGSAIAPDVVIALDVTLANDIPGLTDVDYVTKLGEGTAIKIMDSSLVCHPKLVEHFRGVAETHGIKHQFEILAFGGTDAGGIQRLHGGIPAFTLSVPTRYVHTVNETVHPGDVQASIDLLARYLEDAHNGDYTY